MTQHRKLTRNELSAQITRQNHIIERDTLRMRDAAFVLEEQTRTLKKVRQILASPEAEIDPKGIVATLRLVLEGKL